MRSRHLHRHLQRDRPAGDLVPMEMSKEGLPIGIQFVARWGEHVLIQLAG